MIPYIAVGSAGVGLLLSLVASTDIHPQQPLRGVSESFEAREVVSIVPAQETPVAVPQEVSRQPVMVVVTAPMVIGSSQPIPISLGEFYESLARSPWPEVLWDRVVTIARCESTHDRNAEGDEGRAIGVLQIRVDAHREKAIRYDLRALEDTLSAAWDVYVEAGYSFRPWSCA